MRANPLDNRHQPRARGVLIVALASLVLLLGAGWFTNDLAGARREASIAQALAANGYGEAVSVEPIKGNECWRAREGYRWRTPTSQGWACAGPGSEVTLHVGEPGKTWP